MTDGPYTKLHNVILNYKWLGVQYTAFNTTMYTKHACVLTVELFHTGVH